MKTYSSEDIDYLCWKQKIPSNIKGFEKREKVTSIEPESLSLWEDGICYLKSDGKTWVNLYEPPQTKKQIFQLEEELFAFKGDIFKADSELLSTLKGAEQIILTGYGDIVLDAYFPSGHHHISDVEWVDEYNNSRFC